MKRAAVLFAVLTLFSVSCAAGDADYIGDVGAAVPGDVSDLIGGLPEGGFSSGDIGIGLFLKIVVGAIKCAAPDAAKSFAVLIGLMIISAVIGAFRGTVASKPLGEALEFISVLCVCGAAFSMTSAVFKVAEEFVSGVGVFMQTLIPTLTVLSAAGGNITFATASGVTVSAAMTMLDAVCSSIVWPLLKICFCISVSSAMCGSIDLSGVGAAIKKVITTVLALSGVVLTAVMIFQRIITKSADSAALRGIKFAVSSLIPFVGSAIGEAITTISGSVGVLRATVGISGAIVLCAMVIMPTAGLVIDKLFVDVASGAAALLGLEKEKKFLSEMSGVIGFLIATVAFVGTFFIIAVAVIAGTGVGS